MRLLLDTHVWLWSRIEPDRLSSPVMRALEDRENDLWLSPISVWETLLLIERGRIEVSGPGEGWIRNALVSGPIRDAPLTREVALMSHCVDAIGQDPADRFIAASAIVHELTLVTADKRLAGSTQYRVLVNS